jgi:hypothetical protein
MVDETRVGVTEWTIRLRRFVRRNVLSTHWPTVFSSPTAELTLFTLFFILTHEHFGGLLLKDSGFELNFDVFVLDPSVDKLPDHQLIHFLLLQNLVQIFYLELILLHSTILTVIIIQRAPYFFFTVHDLLVFNWTYEVVLLILAITQHVFFQDWRRYVVFDLVELFTLQLIIKDMRSHLIPQFDLDLCYMK